MREDLHGDVNRAARPYAHGVANGYAKQPLVIDARAIRRCTVADIPWLADLIGDGYGALVDLPRSEQYYLRTMERADHVYLRGTASAVGAKRCVPYWAPLDSRPMASDLFFCARRQKSALVELAEIMGMVVEWAQATGCRQMTFAALNGANIEALCERAGAGQQLPMYRAVFAEDANV